MCITGYYLSHRTATVASKDQISCKPLSGFSTETKTLVVFDKTSRFYRNLYINSEQADDANNAKLSSV